MVPDDLEPKLLHRKISFVGPEVSSDSVRSAAPLEPAVVTQESDQHPGRVVEVGFIENYQPQRFALLSEGFPMWLLALERTFCSEVVVLGFGSAASFRVHLESHVSNPVSVNRAISHLGLG